MDDGLGQGGPVVVTGRVDARVQVRHEAGVDLQEADGELLQIGQRRVTGTEVVDADRDAEVDDLAEVGRGNGAVFDQHAFGELESQRTGAERGRGQQTGQGLAEPAVAELTPGDVDRDPHRVCRAGLPARQLLDRLGQHPLPD